MTVSPLGRPRDPMVERTVFDATLNLLATHGPVRLTLRQVAERAGVARTTIHRRWPTKNALLVAALTRLVNEHQAFPDTNSVRADLIAVCRSRIRLLTSGAGRWLVATVACASDDHALRPALAALAEAERAPTLRVVRRGVDTGELAGDIDAAMAVESLVGPLVSRLLAGKLTADFAAGHVDQVLDGLRPRSPAGAR